MIDILPARTRSSQVRSQPNRQQSLGSIALVFGVIFVSTSIVRLTRSDVDLLLALINTALGVLWLGAGIWLWRFGLRKSKGDQ